jgi:hypothetical protein
MGSPMKTKWSLFFICIMTLSLVAIQIIHKQNETVDAASDAR